MLIGVLSFVSAYAWNGTARIYLLQKFGGHESLEANFIYALTVTITAAVLIYLISTYSNKTEDEENK